MRVLVSGAGIAGPTLAWWLAKAGAHVTILEKNRTFLPHGQAIDIVGSALRVIRQMGLVDEVKRYNTTEAGTRLINPKGNPFACFPIKEGTQVSFTSEFEILRGDLAKVLYKAAKSYPNVEFLLGTTVTKVVSNDDETVKVSLSSGEVREFDLLVAADGQWSKVRKQCFPSESIEVVDKNMYAVYYTMPRLPSDNDMWNVYMTLPSKVITIRPDPHGTVRAMFTLMPCNDAQKKAWQTASKGDRQSQEDLTKKEFSNAGWQAERMLNAMDTAPDFYFQAIQQIKMNKWSNCRVICLGDTAYAPTPLTGMGTSLAITGAYVLAGELSKLVDNEHPTKALDAYEEKFRPFVEEMQKIPFFLPDIAHPEKVWSRWLVHTLLWTLSKIAAIIVAVPWLSNKVADNEEDFKLPQYPKFEGSESGKSGVKGKGAVVIESKEVRGK
jgi:2-polyprenyl-6-methoxyphenol hydroxylase-like FAD-dependent oxidoreductase